MVSSRSESLDSSGEGWLCILTLLYSRTIDTIGERGEHGDLIVQSCVLPDTQLSYVDKVTLLQSTALQDNEATFREPNGVSSGCAPTRGSEPSIYPYLTMPSPS